MLSERSVLIIGIIVLVLLIIWIRLSAPGTRKIKILGVVLGLLWITRFVVDRKNTELGFIETLLDSFIHALQSFSMDADYTKYTKTGKAILENSGYHTLSASYGVMISFLNALAPVLGGAILLEILSASFPILSIYRRPFRHKFVFSEMNEDAVTLAEDIVKNHNYKVVIPTHRFFRPLLIFTDAYKDNESENTSELFNRARAIGAVCIRNDLLHLSLRRSNGVDYFLMDLETNRNLSILASLLNNNPKKKLWPMHVIEGKEEPLVRIFTFLKSETECEIAATIYKRSENCKYVIARNIQDYRNATINLLYSVPLFLPLLKKEKPVSSLTVSILGSGYIGEEVFKNVFWCGQMNNIQLYINVISNNAKALQRRIEERCPELRESCQKYSDLLKCSERQGYNAPYCKYQFTEIEDVRLLSDLSSRVSDGVFESTDYYVIALGRDDLNLEVMNILKKKIMKDGLQKDIKKNPVIALALYDGNLADAVRVVDPQNDMEAPEQAPYIIPFATRESRFSCKNVFMSEITESAQASGILYTKEKAEKESADEYSYWANLVRTVHVPYKMYGIGAVNEINYKESEGFQIQYKEMDYREKEKELSWIEHRRWNAFLRAQGFAHPTPDQYNKYYAHHIFNIGNMSKKQQKECVRMHKNIELKLHPCLVESSIENNLFDPNNQDNLDMVTNDDYHKELNALKGANIPEKDIQEMIGDISNMDYKQYDSYREDYALGKTIYEQAIKYYRKNNELTVEDKTKKIVVILSQQLLLFDKAKKREEAEKKYREIEGYESEYSVEVTAIIDEFKKKSI